jgi:hypothetical protein
MPSSSSNVDRIVGTAVASRQLRGDRAARRLPCGDRAAAAGKSSHERIEMPERADCSDRAACLARRGMVMPVSQGGSAGRAARR